MPQETLRKKEELEETERIYVFDLDGVVTDPETGEVSLTVLEHVATDLRLGRAVAFNTGRPYEWAAERILPHLEATCTPEELKNLLVVAEMGGVMCSYQESHHHIELDDTLSLPGVFIEDVQQLLEREQPEGWRLADFMQWDGLKKTMGSLMKWDHVPVADFDRARPVLEEALKTLLATHKLEDFIIGQTTIATDIQHKTAGKHKGAGQVLAWLEEKGLRPRAFYAFGDSISDKAMAETFAQTGAPTTFVFVGDPQKGSEVQNPAYETVVMAGRHSQDTAEYLVQAG